MPQPTFERELRLARETTWGTAPTNTDEYNGDGSFYSAISTSPLGSLANIEAKHRTKGAVGRRSMDQHAPVAGARRSEGNLDFPFVSSYGGLLLRCALGADSAADTNDATILPSTALTASPQTIGSGFTQPTVNMFPYLRFAFTLAGGATFGAASSVAVTGTLPNGDTYTETINFGAKSANFNVHSQLGWDDISSVVITGVVLGAGSGTITITGIQYTTHTISAADTSASLTADEFGDPSAGSGNVFRRTGQTITGLTLAFNATEEEGIFTITPALAGNFPTAIAQPTYRIPQLRPWPAWTASVTRGGSSYARIQSANIVLTPGSRLYRAAVGAQNPQGKIDVARMVEVTGQLYFDDNTEYNAWINNNVQDFALIFDAPFPVTSTLNQRLTLDLDEAFFTVLNTREDDGMVVAEFTLYTRENATTNVMRATLRNTVNGAY